MKMLISPTLAVSALASPALSFAQASTAPATRAQVDADLVRIEQAGYMPSLRDEVLLRMRSRVLGGNNNDA